MNAAKKAIKPTLTVIFGMTLIGSFIQIFFIGFLIAAPFIAISLVGIFLTLRWKDFKAAWLRLCEKRWGKVLTWALIALIIAAILAFTVISGLMVHAMTIEPAGDAVLIVLGARVNGYQPSLILRLRLEAALEYMNDNPYAVAILTGGLGSRAYISEAESMQRWLVANGICQGRLFLEEHSTSTYENLAFARRIMDEHNLPHDVALASDGFHMFRAQYLAGQVGLSAGAVPSRTPYRLLPYYWLREAIAILFWVIRA